MHAEIVNRSRRFPLPAFVEPPPYGYLHLAAAVEPPTGRVPVVRTSARKAALLAELKARAAQLTRHEAVRRVTVYRAVLMPPAGRDIERHVKHVARYDVVVLVETDSVDHLEAVERADGCRAMRAAMVAAGRDLHVMTARCGRYVADVDRDRDGLFLFNHFDADDEQVALEVWEHLAGWYVKQTGLDNSTLLVPVDKADYVFVNHARWDQSLLGFMLRQFTRPSFWTYQQANLKANRVRTMPILYRLA